MRSSDRAIERSSLPGSQLLSDVQTFFIKIIIKISVRTTPVVICSRRAAKTANFFISKMNNNGATPRIERTDTVPVGVVEEVLNNNVNDIDYRVKIYTHLLHVDILLPGLTIYVFCFPC